MEDPTGTPRTVSPWCVAGRLGLPTQTSGPNEAMFEVDAGMVMKVGRQEVIDWADSLWCDSEIKVVQESHEVFVRC